MFIFCPNCGTKNTNPHNDPFVCTSCKKTFYFNSKPTSSVIPVFNDEILLAVRAEDPGKGELDTVGGFLNNGEDPLIGAIREFKEETGFQLEKEQLTFLGIWIDRYPDGDIIYHTFNVVYTVQFDKKHILIPNDDVADLQWMRLSDLKPYTFDFLQNAVNEIRRKYE